MKHREKKMDVLSKINYFFTNQYSFFRIYSEDPKFIFNLIFHLTVSILSILIIYNDKIRSYIKNFKNFNSFLNTDFLTIFKASISVFDILIFSVFFFILIKLFKSRKKFKHVLAIVCASYYFISFQKILNCGYQIISKEHTNHELSVMTTVIDSIFKYYNIFSIFFIIFVMIGLYILTNIDIKKLCVGTICVEIVNLTLIIFIAIFTLPQNDLVTFKRTLIHIFSKRG